MDGEMKISQKINFLKPSYNSEILKRALTYSMLALAIMGPMLKSGYVLTLDMVFTPKISAPVGISNSYLFQWLIHILNLTLPAQIVEKVIIFLILLLCGLSMHSLVDIRDKWPRYFAGLFYMVNPFTYERWMAGQYLVLAGYALIPFAVKALINLLEKPTQQNALKVSLWLTAIAIPSPHMLALSIFVGIIMFLTYLLAKSPKGTYYRDLLHNGGLAVIGVLILNSYWLAYFISGKSTLNQVISSIGKNDLTAFATAGNGHTGLFFNVLSLYGFWLERFKRYAMPNHILWAWILIFIIFMFLIIIGIKKTIRSKSLPAVALIISASISFVFALGPYAAITGNVTKWAILHIPLMRGFREPEKFSALLVLAYAYFAGYGLDVLLKHIPYEAEGRLELARDGALLLPLLYVSTMPLGFAGQLKAVNYPASWYVYESSLYQHPIKGKLLFLPWNEYMSYNFSSRIIANPAPDFFSANVISGTNAQFGGLDDPTPTPTSKYIENNILAHTNQINLGAKMAKLHIQYILLADGYDFDQYGWLAHQSDLKLVSSQPGLIVYRNEAYSG
jgi:hypothetical protein